MSFSRYSFNPVVNHKVMATMSTSLQVSNSPLNWTFYLSISHSFLHFTDTVLYGPGTLADQFKINLIFELRRAGHH